MELNSSNVRALGSKVMYIFMQGFILMFDVNDPESLNAIEKLKHEIDKLRDKDKKEVHFTFLFLVISHSHVHQSLCSLLSLRINRFKSTCLRPNALLTASCFLFKRFSILLLFL